MLRTLQALGLLLVSSAGLAQQAVAVIEAAVTRQPLAVQIETVATVLAAESVAISASVADQVSKLHFSEGATVAAGELLLELRHAEEAAALRGAQARLQEKRSALNRVQELQAQKLASPAELELAEAALLAARAAVQEQQAILEDFLIKAPFAGVLGLREVAPGQYVTPGQALTWLYDLSSLRLEFNLAQTDLQRLGAPLTLQAYLPGGGQRQSAMLEGSAGQFDPATRNLRLRARLSTVPSGLHPGALMLVEISGPAHDALLVPESALIGSAEGQFVFVNDQGKARRQGVRSGQRREGAVEILEGLREGERVIVHGGHKLKPGAALQVLGVYDGSRPLAELIRAADAQP